LILPFSDIATSPNQHKFEQDETEAEDMLEEYDFSKAKPARHQGFQGSLIRVSEDGKEQAIELKNKRPEKFT
jgi:hypothetical protein